MKPFQKTSSSPGFWAVADVETEDLPLSGRTHAGGHHHSHRGHLAGLVADMKVGRVEVDVGELDVVQGSGAERPNGLVQAGADPRDLGLGDP
jgi:hypothetical protein